jgi:hypothetical protein
LNIKWPVVTMKYGMSKREKMTFASMNAQIGKALNRRKAPDAPLCTNTKTKTFKDRK